MIRIMRMTLKMMMMMIMMMMMMITTISSSQCGKNVGGKKEIFTVSCTTIILVH